MNYIWIFFIVVSAIVGLLNYAMTGDSAVVSAVVDSTFKSSKVGFEISLYLTGVMTLWMGLMRVGEAGGVVGWLSRLISPLFCRLFPGVPKGHSAHGSMTMNIAANMLGLDNAATPMGLKAMRDLQALNDEPSRATNAQIMFLVLNTSGLTLLPVTIMAYRQQCGAANPSDVFLPLLLSTYFSTMAGIVAVAIVQKIKLWNGVVLAYLGGLTVFVGLLSWFLGGLPQEEIASMSKGISACVLLVVIAGFVGMAAWRRVNVYDTFIEGAKDGFKVSVGIIPFLVAMLVSIGMFRASGALDYLLEALRWLFGLTGCDTRFVDALPTAMMKPLSGSGARGFMIEAMNTYGADSFVGRLSCLFQGATDTTFYVLAVYFGSVGIKDTRHAVACGLAADVAGIVAAIFIGYIFFG